MMYQEAGGFSSDRGSEDQQIADCIHHFLIRQKLFLIEFKPTLHTEITAGIPSLLTNQRPFQVMRLLWTNQRPWCAMGISGLKLLRTSTTDEIKKFHMQIPWPGWIFVWDIWYSECNAGVECIHRNLISHIYWNNSKKLLNWDIPGNKSQIIMNSRANELLLICDPGC